MCLQSGGLKHLLEAFASQVRFVLVYVMEAHAKDQWPLGVERSVVAQHKTTEERIQAARYEMTQVHRNQSQGIDA